MPELHSGEALGLIDLKTGNVYASEEVMKGMGGVVVGLYDGLEVKIKKSQ